MVSLRNHFSLGGTNSGVTMRTFYFLLISGVLGLGSSLPAEVVYNEDPIKSFHMSDVEPMMAESDRRMDVVFAGNENNTDDSDGIQPRSIPYTKAERRRYVHKARLSALRDDSNEFDDFDFKVRGKTASAYDSSEEDYDDAYMGRAARKPFQGLRNYFRSESGPYFKSEEPAQEKPTQTFLSRFKSFFRQAPTNKPQAREPPRQKQKRRPQKNNDNSKYQVIFWPITTTDTDGMTSTNLVPHLVVRNPKRQEEILYAVPLVQLSQHGNYNIFHTADEKEINSIKTIKSKKRKNRPASAPQQQRPSVNDDEVMMEHIIQSGSDVEDETTTSPPPVPSFIFVGDNPADTEEDVDDADVDSDNKLRTIGQHKKNRTYRRRYNNKHRW